MELFFLNPDEVPLPPNEVRIRELNAEPWPDGKRVRIAIEVDPFQKRPNIDILISNQDGKPVAVASIIESMTKKMEITMHLRGTPTVGQYHVRAELYYQQKAEVDNPETSPPIITQVDLAETIFMIENKSPEADNNPGNDE